MVVLAALQGRQSGGEEVMEPHLFSSLGQTYIWIARHPGVSLTELSSAMFLSKRGIADIVGKLMRAGLICNRKAGRISHYEILPKATVQLFGQRTSLSMLFSSLVTYDPQSDS